MILSAIVAAEIGFWVVLLAGLCLRYLLRLRRTGLVVLALIPLVDLALLVFTVLQLRSGAEVEPTAGLAAVYLSVTVVYGHRMIRWADVRFAHRFAGGPPPPRLAKSSPEYARNQRALWYRHVLAYALGSALLLGEVALVGDLARAGGLLSWIGGWTTVLVVDFVWSFSYTWWPPRPKPGNEKSRGEKPGGEPAEPERSTVDAPQ